MNVKAIYFKLSVNLFDLCTAIFSFFFKPDLRKYCGYLNEKGIIPAKKDSLVVVIFLLAGVFLSSKALGQNKALVIIDMQPPFAERGGYHTRAENRVKIDQLYSKLRKLINLAKKNSIPILLIEYNGFGETDNQLIQEIGDYDKSAKFIKSTDGVFSPNSGVDLQVRQYLDQQDISQLLVAGANGGYCVACSIEGAIKKGYEVWVDPFSVIDFNYVNFIFPYHYEKGFRKLSEHDFNNSLKQISSKNPIEEFFNFAQPEQAQFARCEGLFL